MGAAIRIEKLTKMYGRHRGVLDLDLEVAPGEVFGYLGPNGAGKTTTIRLLMGLIHPTRGTATVLGVDPWADGIDLHRRVGYVPGELALYENLTGRELFAYLAQLRGGVDWGRIGELASRFDLDLSRHIRTLSRGNKQKVGLLQAFLHRPELLVLDEPTSGLDPLVQEEFHGLVRESTAEGATVFLSSHVLHEVEHMADRVAIIREGKLVVVEEVDSLKAKAVQQLEIRFAAPVDLAAFAAVPGVEEVTVEGEVLRCRVVGSADPLVKAIARFEVSHLASHEPDLEDIFLAYYGRAGDGG